jgi:hypothetical protein
MSNCTRYLGLDVHAEPITAAITEGRQESQGLLRIRGRPLNILCRRIMSQATDGTRCECQQECRESEILRGQWFHPVDSSRLARVLALPCAVAQAQQPLDDGNGGEDDCLLDGAPVVKTPAAHRR